MTFGFHTPQQSPGFVLWQITNEWQRRQKLALKSLGLTHVQFVLLAGIYWFSLQKKVPSQKMIAEHAKTDVMMTSQVLRTLEAKQLVKRKRADDDIRSNKLMLTQKGKKIVLQAIPVVEGVDRKFFKENYTELSKLAIEFN